MHGGHRASTKCKHEIYRFFCMEIFPPCESDLNYGVFPCQEYCSLLSEECLEYSPFDCPLDSPSNSSTSSSFGTHFNSNNNFQSCFTANATIIPYPFLLLHHLFFLYSLQRVVLILLSNVNTVVVILQNVPKYSILLFFLYSVFVSLVVVLIVHYVLQMMNVMMVLYLLSYIIYSCRNVLLNLISIQIV